MQITYKTDGVEVVYDKGTTNSEKRIIENGVSLLVALIVRMNEIENKEKKNR